MKRDMGYRQFMDRAWTPDAMIQFLVDHGWRVERNSKHIQMIFVRDGIEHHISVPHRARGKDLSDNYKNDVVKVMWPDRHKKIES